MRPCSHIVLTVPTRNLGRYGVYTIPQAFDCFTNPYLDFQNAVLRSMGALPPSSSPYSFYSPATSDRSSFWSPPISPRLPLRESTSTTSSSASHHGGLPSLVRRLSARGAARRRRSGEEHSRESSTDGRPSSHANRGIQYENHRSSKQEDDDGRWPDEVQNTHDTIRPLPRFRRSGSADEKLQNLPGWPSYSFVEPQLARSGRSSLPLPTPAAPSPPWLVSRNIGYHPAALRASSSPPVPLSSSSVDGRRLSFEMARSGELSASVPPSKTSPRSTSPQVTLTPMIPRSRSPSPLSKEADERRGETSRGSVSEGRAPHQLGFSPRWSLSGGPERRGSTPHLLNSPKGTHPGSSSPPSTSPSFFAQKSGTSSSNATHPPSMVTETAVERRHVNGRGNGSRSSSPTSPFHPSRRSSQQEQPRPASRRSLSSSFISLGKKVASLGSSTSRDRARHRDSGSSSATSPSAFFKVNSVVKVESPHSPAFSDPRGVIVESPRHSFSVSRPTSPLVAQHPMKAGLSPLAPPTGPKKVDASAGEYTEETRALLVPHKSILHPRPLLNRAVRSEDGLAAMLRHPTGISESHLAAARMHTSYSASQLTVRTPSGGPSSTRSQSPPSSVFTSRSNLMQTSEVSISRYAAPPEQQLPSHHQDWQASLRGKVKERRPSVAELFDHEPDEGNNKTSEIYQKEDKQGNDDLDFTKKPVLPMQNLSDHPPHGTTSSMEGRGRTTSHSSLLSASRPHTPATSVPNSPGGLTATLRPLSRLSPAGSPSTTPSSASDPAGLKNAHRHTQSLPPVNDFALSTDGLGIKQSPVRGANGRSTTPSTASSSAASPSLIAIAALGPESSVLKAAHARFAAALTAAAAETGSAPSSPTISKARTRSSHSLRKKRSLGSPSMATESDSNGSGVSSCVDQQRLPKLSYGNESSTADTDDVATPNSATSPLASSKLAAFNPPDSADASRLMKAKGDNDAAVAGKSGLARRSNNASSDSTNTVGTVTSLSSHTLAHEEEGNHRPFKVAVW